MTSSAVLRRALVPVLLAVVVVLTTGASAVARPVGAALVDAGRPHPSSGTGPDLRSVFTATADGAPLHVSFWFPTTGPGPAPILVWIHGGGWIAGSDVDRPADLRRFAQEGWLVMSVEYELARPGRPTWNLAGPQVACARGRLSAEAGAAGGDFGGWCWQEPQPMDSWRCRWATERRPEPRSPPAGSRSPCRAPWSRNTRPSTRSTATNTGYPADSQNFKRAYTGGTPAEVPERYRAVTGIDALSPESPPTLLVEAGTDRPVPTAGLERSIAAARSQGVQVDRVVVTGAHAFDAVDWSPGRRVGHAVLTKWARRQVACRRSCRSNRLQSTADRE